MVLLTLSVHAQEGYGSHSVCVSGVYLSVCYYIFGDIIHLYVTIMIAISFARYTADIYKHYFVVKKFCSNVMPSFTYCNIHWCYCSERLLDFFMTEPSALLEKASDR